MVQAQRKSAHKRRSSLDSNKPPTMAKARGRARAPKRKTKKHRVGTSKRRAKPRRKTTRKKSHKKKRTYKKKRVTQRGRGMFQGSAFGHLRQLLHPRYPASLIVSPARNPAQVY
jgi:hypothetical protein